jgi:nicotinate phosphoribosyltransferase
VTCESQPALGCVFKLVEINGAPRIKLSNNVAKVTIPAKKDIYRIYGKDGPLVDLMTLSKEAMPRENAPIFCHHPFDETKRAFVKPAKLVPMLHLYWDGKALVPCSLWSDSI